MTKPPTPAKILNARQAAQHTQKKSRGSSILHSKLMGAVGKPRNKRAGNAPRVF